MNDIADSTCVAGNDVIGVVGGMGPDAGVMMCDYISSYTPAITDQEHLSLILMSFPGCIGDRTAFIEGESSVNPGEEIAKVILKLENAGAGLIGIACNTSYTNTIFDAIEEVLYKEESQAKVLNMPEETCNVLVNEHPGAKRIGVMSTTGTYKSGVYDQILRERGYEIVRPEMSFQQDVINRIIYDPVFGLKASRNRNSWGLKTLIQKAFDFYENNHVDVVILACTELSLVLKEGDTNIPLIDSTKSLARALVREALQRRTIPYKERQLQ